MSDSDPFVNETDENQDELLSDATSISEEDRQEILADIEEVVKKNRISVSDELFRITPQKKGFLLPTLINLMAILSVAAGFYFSARFFEDRQENLNLEGNAISTAENRLIEELKRESDARVAQKEDEINQIQQELERIETQSQSLQQDFESAIAQREAQLRSEMEAELEVERSRLQALGIQPEEIENRLREFELQKQRELESRLEEYRVQTQAELQAREQELQQARNAAQQILAEANSEREQILEESAEREAELASRFASERQALEEASSEAQTRLEEIARRQENEDLFTDQILASYESIIDRMRGEEFEIALGEIETLRELLRDPRIENLPRISKRREVERFIMNTLEDEIQVELGAESADTTGLVDAAQRLFSARNLVNQGETALAEGNTGRARELFQNAIATVPAIESAVNRLEELQVDERKRLSLQYLTEGEDFLKAGNTTQALAAYKQAADAVVNRNQESLEEAIARLEATLRQDTRSELVAENEAALQELRQGYEERIAGLQEEFGTTEADIQQELNAALAAVEASEATLAGKDAELAELNALIDEGRGLLAEYEARAARAEAALAAAAADSPVPATGGGTLSDEEIAALREEYQGEIEKLRSDYGSELAQREQQLEELNSSIARTEQALEATETRLARSETERSQLEEDLNAAVVELVDVVTRQEGDDRYASLARNYTEYQARLQNLLDDGERDYNRAEGVLEEFLTDEQIQNVFPRLGEFASRISAWKADRAEARGRIEGRQSAFGDAERYASLLADDEFRRAGDLLDQAEEEDPYLQALEKIQELAVQSNAAPAAAGSKIRLLGTVAAVQGDLVVIESLAGSNTSDGARFTIRRRTAEGEELVLAEGVITAVSGSNIRGRITGRLLEGTSPRIIDLVYLVSQD